jgi:nitric oxide reductase subunit B
VVFTFVPGFAVLILLTVKTYENAPPVPEQLVNPVGMTISTGDDVRRGQVRVPE